jgi:antitoxin HicB
MKKNDYPVVIYPAEEGGFVAEIPALPGCLAQGETMLECLEELNTVKALWIETAKKHKQKLPNVEAAYRKVRSLSV